MIRTAMVMVVCSLAASQAYGQAAAKKIAEKIGSFVDPTSSLDVRGFAAQPLARPVPEWLDRPQSALAKPEPIPPLVPAPARPAYVPRPVVEGSPLLLNYGNAESPAATSLATMPLLKQYVVEMRKAIELPALAVYSSDRVSLADPSMEASVQSALRPPQPDRVNQTPFAPWNIPDPFENAQTIRLRQPWPETVEPPLFVQPPTRR